MTKQQELVALIKESLLEATKQKAKSRMYYPAFSLVIYFVMMGMYYYQNGFNALYFAIMAAAFGFFIIMSFLWIWWSYYYKNNYRYTNLFKFIEENSDEVWWAYKEEKMDVTETEVEETTLIIVAKVAWYYRVPSSKELTPKILEMFTSVCPNVIVGFSHELKAEFDKALFEEE